MICYGIKIMVGWQEKTIRSGMPHTIKSKSSSEISAKQITDQRFSLKMKCPYWVKYVGMLYITPPENNIPSILGLLIFSRNVNRNPEFVWPAVSAIVTKWNTPATKETWRIQKLVAVEKTTITHLLWVCWRARNELHFQDQIINVARL